MGGKNMKEADLMNFAEMFRPVTTIISVEKLPDGKLGNICIEGANKESVKIAEQAFNMDGTQVVKKFVPGLPYENYMKKERNFENFCYQCAVLGKPVHAYIQPEHFNFWINLFMLPLNIQDGNKYYCVYSQEISTEADFDTMTNLPAEISSNVLKTCIKLRKTTDFRLTLNEIVDDIREICGAESCSILLTDYANDSCSVLAHSIKEGLPTGRSVFEIFSNAFIKYSKDWIDALDGSNCLILQQASDFEEVCTRNPGWHATLVESHVESLVLLPLQSNGAFIGFIWVANFDTSKTLRIKETLELTTFFIASEIANYQLLERLKILSSTDFLTGVKNRNAMNSQVVQYVEGKIPCNSIGVVFADLNGLKAVNDSEGHDAGDRLLSKAASILKLGFGDAEIYRAGGDEFVVIVRDKPESWLRERVEKIRNKSRIPGKVSFAIGLSYDEHASDIRKAMHEADVRMYNDKKLFYELFPNLRR